MILGDPVNVPFISKGGLDLQVEDHHFKEKEAQRWDQILLTHKGCRKKGQRGQSQTVRLFWILILTGLSSQCFLKGKSHAFDCQDYAGNGVNGAT